MVDDAIDHPLWWTILEACIQADGDHFEHRLWRCLREAEAEAATSHQPALFRVTFLWGKSYNFRVWKITEIHRLWCLFSFFRGVSCRNMDYGGVMGWGFVPSPPLSSPSPSRPSLPFPLPPLPVPPPPLRSRPLNPARGSGGAVSSPSGQCSPAGSGVEPQPKLNLVHFSLKIWHLMATILMIFPRVNWLHAVLCYCVGVLFCIRPNVCWVWGAPVWPSLNTPLFLTIFLLQSAKTSSEFHK